MASTVSVQEGIRYGFGLLGYLLGVGGIGGITLLVGFGLFRSGGILAALGGLLVIAGGVVVYAGFLGIAYKVIADGVKIGVEAAE